MIDKDLALTAHLIRRTGFCGPFADIEIANEKSYDETVEAILHPGKPENMPDDLIRRYQQELSNMINGGAIPPYWLYRMVTTKTPLQDKMSLFWHGIFATAVSKLTHGADMMSQIEMFQKHGLGNFKTLLLEISKDPSMMVWLDNCDNHNGAINENYGRELLELFSMGVGNYTEKDIKECARAFTGWTVGNADYMVACAVNNSVWPYGRIVMHTEYRPEDHDDGEKTFLGETGKFNGDDIIDIICKQPATANFIARHMYSFFVADEPPVSQWAHTPPHNPEAIQILSQAYFDNNYDIRAMLRVLLNSDFFRSEECWYAKVKSPAELVAGVLRLSGGIDEPFYEFGAQSQRMAFMGQQVGNPPSVEGWHQGTEWIDSGTLIERVNFATEHLGNPTKPGVRSIIDRVENETGPNSSSDDLIEKCLDLMGGIQISDTTRTTLNKHTTDNANESREAEVFYSSEERIRDIVRLVAATPEFQLV